MSSITRRQFVEAGLSAAGLGLVAANAEAAAPASPSPAAGAPASEVPAAGVSAPVAPANWPFPAPAPRTDLTFTHEPKFPLGGFLPQAPAAPRTIREPARDVPVVAECDVAVFGGGPAGVCAAAAAARAGKRVVLVERHGCLGGMSTVGWVSRFHTLYGTDRKTKTIGGLPEEFLRRLQRLGAVRNLAGDGETGDWDICGETGKFVWDDLALSSGVRLMLHTQLVGAVRDGRRMTAALVENKSGRGAVAAGVFIDCTGDADMVRHSGGGTQVGNPEGKCQAPTLVFRVGGKAEKATGLGQIFAALSKIPMDYNNGPYPCYLWGAKPIWDRAEQMMAGTRVLGVNVARADDLTRAEVEARYQLRWILRNLKALGGYENSYLIDMGAQIGLRESHRILADRLLTGPDLLEGKVFPDTIAQGTYPVDIHTPDAPGIVFRMLDGTFRRQGTDGRWTSGRWDGQPAGAAKRKTLCWSAPLAALVARDFDNVLAAGRCIGADHEAAGAIRVMINCMQFGQAAGTAAAMAKAGANIREVDAAKVRAALKEAGAPLREA